MTDLKTPLCIECGSHNVRYDSEFGFYKCESCSTVWGLDEDDPDYKEPLTCPECKSFLEELVDEMEVFYKCPICNYHTA